MNNLFEYTLRLGDNSLILGQRLSEWCGHGPILEEDIAMTNIALDLVGQSRLFLDYAAKIEGQGRTEDDLAFHRDVMDYRNALLTEQENGDFGVTMVRQFLFDTYNYFLYQELKNSKDAQLASIAEKSIKEVTYHLRHSSQWVIRLGAGTEESHQRAQNALNELWKYTGDLFAQTEGDLLLIKDGIAANNELIKQKWEQKVKEVFHEATLNIPKETYMMEGSRKGQHTERLGYILAEMQFLPRAYPGAKW